MMLFLAACTPVPIPPLPTPTDDTPSPVTPALPELVSPAEAVDLDPSPTVLRVALTASAHTRTVDGVVVEGLAYNAQVPGPTLRAMVGDTLEVELLNDLDEPTTIHWHGVHVPYAMDGAGWQVAPVPPGGRFTYTFPLNEPGTFWYHPHFNTDHQVDRGLYGVLVVEDPSDPPVDAELVVVFDSIGEVEQGIADPAIDPSPTWWSVNGLRDPVWRPASGSSVRVRTVNVSNAGYLQLAGRVVATDQGVLAAETEVARLVPGDRADLEVAVGAGSRSWSTPRITHAGEVPEVLPLFTVEPEGTDPAPAALGWSFTGTLPTPDPGRTDLRYTFTGSATEGWAINGQTWPDIEPDEVALGSEVVLEIRNVSPVHHPFHLHGMPFEVLSVNGIPPQVFTLEDTFDIGVQQVVRLRILADNPGEWMSHCHLLPHAEAGMMTVLRVQEP